MSVIAVASSALLLVDKRPVGARQTYVGTMYRPWRKRSRREREDASRVGLSIEISRERHTADGLTNRAFSRQGSERTFCRSKSSLIFFDVSEIQTSIHWLPNAPLATNKLFELSGTRYVPSDLNLDRHWRDARAHTLHDPVRWKLFAIGDYVVNGHKPARHSWI